MYLYDLIILYHLIDKEIRAKHTESIAFAT